MSTITNLLLPTPTPTRVTLIVSFLAHDCWTQRQHLRHVGLSTEVVWCESFPFVYPAYCESCDAQTIRQPAGDFVHQGTHPAPQCTVYASAVHLFLSRYMRHKLKTRCMTLAINAHTTPTRVRALHSDWRSTWERGCQIRKAEFAKRNTDGERVVATYEQVGALLGICLLHWIQTLLHYRGSLEMPCGITDKIPCVYITFCAGLKGIYVGSRGASHYHTRHWGRKLSVQGGRCLLHRVKEHIGKMRWVRGVEGFPRGASWSAARMYSLTSPVGIERWEGILWICTSPDTC